MPSYFRVVLTTAPTEKKADALAKGIVAARLAACVNVVPGVVSHYRWQGRMTRDAECLLLVKTSAAKFPKLRDYISTHHPYSVPELLALKVDAGSKAYLKWLTSELA